MSEDLPSIVLYGSSGHARSHRLLRRSIFDTGPPFRLAAYIDDFIGGKGAEQDGVPIIDFETWRTTMRELPCIVTVGSARDRRKLVARVEDAGGTFFTCYPADGLVCPDLIVGNGTTVGSSSVVAASVVIGCHSQVMEQAQVGHDCVIGDFVTFCSGARTAGYVTIEDDVYVGTGALIVTGAPNRRIRIGRGAVVAAGAVVTKSVASGVRVMGNPARDMRSLAAERARAPSQG